MYAVVRHTYKIDIPEPNNPNSTKSSAKWIHRVWIFETELDALSYAISLLDDPLIRSNEYMLESAINQLKEDRFYQVGRESVAIAEVEYSPEIIYEETEVIYDDNKKSIH
jgi:hypothetical protein|tara:strand:- start:2006 stop:2335 length:330 start_codon:yes stop_codon:yes gene_type:complete